MTDPYDILGLTPNTPIKEVKKAYKLYVGKLHPDKHNVDPFFDNLLKRINEAYSKICNGEFASSSVGQDAKAKNTNYQPTVDSLQQEIERLKSEREHLLQNIAELQSNARNTDAMQVQINMLQAALKMYECTAKLRESTLTEQDEIIERYQQNMHPLNETSDTGIKWIVALAIGIIILIILIKN